ncbi:ankyrin repeat-containing domain protein, partial [Trichophaea hybrida]
VEFGVEIDKHGGNYGSALQAASTEGHHQIVRLLLEKGADVNCDMQGERGYGAALQGAVLRGHGRIVLQLLEKRANVNVRAADYGTALQAVKAGLHFGIAELLENKANV